MKWVYQLYLTLIWPIFALLYRPKVVRLAPIPPGAHLICGNHTSLTDPILAGMALGHRHHIHFMAKSELMRIPVFGWLLKQCGAFSVDRGKSDIESIKTALRILKSGGLVGIFPEGQRVRGGEDAAAKTGVAMLAARSGAAVVPVYLSPDRRAFRRATVVIGAPFKPDFGGGRGDQASYRRAADDLMERIKALGSPSEGKL